MSSNFKNLKILTPFKVIYKVDKSKAALIKLITGDLDLFPIPVSDSSYPEASVGHL